MKATQAALAAALALAFGGAHAQSSVTLYGSVDQYVSALRSSSGTHVLSLEDGALLRSRLGFRGEEDLGAGLRVKFNLEQGLFADTGTLADPVRGMDRQAWVGVASSIGEFRAGRQNSALFYRGDFIDYTSRTLGSVVNAFGVPSRYDNDLSYISPRWAGFLFEAHYALGETSVSFGNQAVYQAAVDYLHGPFRAGYAGLVGRAPSNAVVNKNAEYHNLYANYEYGHGKLYAAYVRSNNSVTAANGIDNGGTLLGNTGGVVAGTNPQANRYYHIASLSADYNVNGALRIGALYGRITDEADSAGDAHGYSFGAYYSLSKRTTLLAIYHAIDNGPAAGFRPSGSGPVRANFTNPNDVNGRTISGLAIGVVHRF